MKTATPFKFIKIGLSAIALALSIVLAPSAALSQAGSGPGKVYTPWSKQGKLAAGISVTTGSAATALPSTGLSAWVCNTGSNDAYLEFGSSGVSATTTAGTWLKASTCATYDLYPAGQASRYGYVAAITASSTTTLTVETGSGQGPDQLVASGGGGGGGGTSSSFGSAFPGTGTAAGFSDGTNMAAARVTSAALADGFTPPTSGLLQNQAFAMLFNGTTFDRLRGDSTNGAWVNVKTSALPTGAATAANQSTLITNLGAPGDTACTTDAGSCAINAKLSRIAQNLTTINTSVNGDVPNVTAPLNAGAAVATKSLIVGGQYLSIQPTMTNTQQAGLLFSSRGELLVAPGVSGFNLSQGGTALSTTNGAYFNQLQGNAVLSATNPTFARLTDGTNAQVTDPCQAVTKLYKAFSQTATAVLVTGAASKKTYVCSISIIAGAAEIFNLTAGTGSTCGTNTVAVMGSTTAANGLSLAANGGLTFGSGLASLAATTVNQDDLCLQQSGSNRLAGGITYVQL